MDLRSDTLSASHGLIGHRGTRVTRACLASTVILFALGGVQPNSASPVLATTTTITFDDLASGTAVSNQYHSQGVDFEKGIIGGSVYCYPVIAQVSSNLAQSGNQVANISCANGEFPDSAVRGR
jgi:hypothetical protein